MYLKLYIYFYHQFYKIYMAIFNLRKSDNLPIIMDICTDMIYWLFTDHNVRGNPCRERCTERLGRCAMRSARMENSSETCTTMITLNQELH